MYTRVAAEPVTRTLWTVTGDQSVLLGLVFYLLVAATPTLFVWAAVRLLPVVFGALVDVRLRRRPPERRASLECVVGSLRRLRRELRCGPPSQTRRLALLSAYDDTLVQACRLVGVDPPLADAAPAERPFARLLTEAQLEEAGIAIDPPSGANAA